MDAELRLPNVYKVQNPDQFKLHLACYNGQVQPLEVFVRDREEWDDWNTWRSSRDDFSREYIFALIDFYHEKDTWLFGGAYKVLSRRPKDRSHSYKVQLLTDSQPWVGRLKLRLKRPSRGKAINLENYYEQIIVSEILSEPYMGQEFPGYDRINLTFPELENIIERSRPDWRAALQNAKGVYLITDQRTAKRYVGAAYGVLGIWSRWECYVGTCHGHNDELTKLISARGPEYARKNFRFALLEYCSMKTDDEVVIAREQYWKEALLSRGKHGYNKN